MKADRSDLAGFYDKDGRILPYKEWCDNQQPYWDNFFEEREKEERKEKRIDLLLFFGVALTAISIIALLLLL